MKGYKDKQELFQKAQEGSVKALSIVRKLYKCKVYTNEEIRIVNKIRSGRYKMSDGDIINVRDRDAFIDIPRFDGKMCPARINWLQQLEDGKPYYRAGLSLADLHNGYGAIDSEWVLKLDPDVGFKPLFCSTHWNVEESDEEEKLGKGGQGSAQKASNGA